MSKVYLKLLSGTGSIFISTLLHYIHYIFNHDPRAWMKGDYCQIMEAYSVYIDFVYGAYVVRKKKKKLKKYILKKIFFRIHCVTCRRGRPSPALQKREWPGYDIKLHLTVRLQLWSFEECGVTSSLPLLPGPLWPRVVVTIRVQSIG